MDCRQGACAITESIALAGLHFVSAGERSPAAAHRGPRAGQIGASAVQTFGADPGAVRPCGVECVATATHIPTVMKTATFPSLRVDPELREAAESVLQEGETLSGLIETSVRETIDRRRTRAEFIARGLASRDEAKRTGVYIDADDVLAQLAQKLAKAKSKLQKKARA